MTAADDSMQIRIVEYDPTWPSLFVVEALRIRATMQDLVLRIDHVGSTAVPGLDAKPVIDIQISVSGLDPLTRYAAPLAQLGYCHVPLEPGDQVYPFFQRPHTWPSTHHVHLCVHGSIHEQRHLAFRDYLKDHPKLAAQYVLLKRYLAAQHDGESLESRERYSLSKTRFIGEVVALAISEGYPLA